MALVVFVTHVEFVSRSKISSNAFENQIVWEQKRSRTDVLLFWKHWLLMDLPVFLWWLLLWELRAISGLCTLAFLGFLGKCLLHMVPCVCSLWPAVSISVWTLAGSLWQGQDVHYGFARSLNLLQMKPCAVCPSFVQPHIPTVFSYCLLVTVWRSEAGSSPLLFWQRWSGARRAQQITFSR